MYKYRVHHIRPCLALLRRCGVRHRVVGRRHLVAGSAGGCAGMNGGCARMVGALRRVCALRTMDVSWNSAVGTSCGFIRLVDGRISSWSCCTPLLFRLTLDRRSGTCLDAVWRLFCTVPDTMA
ncbi:unnamed protein product [Tenebrio molitor]|nr:unnamed protein product [Tenebrio molitor]